MTAYESIQEAFCTLVHCQQAEDGAWVATHCLYSSNSWVRVRVRGRADEFVVSDEGGAVEEVTSIGLAFPEAERRIRRIARKQGLRVSKGMIYSPPVSIEGLRAATILVANVSKEAAHWVSTYGISSASKLSRGVDKAHRWNGRARNPA